MAKKEPKGPALAQGKWGASIKPCVSSPLCRPHHYQDTLYGTKNRVFSWGPKAATGGSAGYRCTVCGASRG